ncbi:hypothetical protein SY88_03420 [Clostridiales bacterium PH28_bin88]|nr:hypothetical protein SY88_03420 [Clostridiales bacterium PH28_bin88]
MIKKTWLAPSFQAQAEALVALMPQKVLLSDGIKKLLALGLLALLLLAVGCTWNSLAVFQKAQKKTEAISKGKDSLTMAMAMTFREDGMTEEQKKVVNAMKDFRLEVNQIFDHRQQTRLAKFYAHVSGTGIDGKLYQRGKENFIVTPLLPKILVLQSEKLQRPAPGGTWNTNPQPGLSADTLRQIKDIWLGLLKKENVVHLGNIILATPEGDVKAKEFTIKLGEAEIKPALRESLEMLLNDDLLQQSMKEYFAGQQVELNLQEFLTQNRNMLDRSTIENFDYKAYIDRDGYLVEENINLTVKFKETLPGQPEKYTMRMKIQRWDIERDVQVDFPEVTPDNSMTLGDLRQDGLLKGF